MRSLRLHIVMEFKCAVGTCPNFDLLQSRAQSLHTCKEGLVTQVQILGLTSTSATTAWYMLCAFKAYINIWKSFLYIYCTSSPSGHTLLKAGFHKVTKELQTSFYWYSEYHFQLAPLSPVCNDTTIRFIFQFAFLHLELQGFSTSTSPRIRLVHGTTDPGWGLSTRLDLLFVASNGVVLEPQLIKL